jgi:amidase
VQSLVGVPPEPEVQRALDATISLCVELGHQVVPAEPLRVDGAALSRGFFTLAGSTLGGIVSMMEQALGRRVGKADLEPFTRSLIEAAAASADGLSQARIAFQDATQRYLEATAGYDVVLTPTLGVPPWPIGWLSPVLEREELIQRTERAVGYTPIQTIAGCPAMSVPLHWTARGIPIGSHFAAAPGREDVLFGLAYELESARPWADRWAPHSFVRLAAL